MQADIPDMVRLRSGNRRWLVLGALVSVGALLGSGVVGTSSANAADPEAPPSASAARSVETTPPGDVFTKPRYLPFRDSARIGCVYSNCISGGKPDHGYWALDFTAPRGTLVYAAGGGIANITDPASKCDGGSLWIDHGGGDSSRYVHLGSILVSNGQVVSEDTPIGTFGGDSCTSNSLHFATKDTGPFPTRDADDPGELRACVDGSGTTFPAVLGFSSWNSIPFGTRWAYSQGTGCWNAPRQAGPPSKVQVKHKPKKLVARWKRTGINSDRVLSYRIGYRHLSKKKGTWTKQRYVTVSGSLTKAKVRTHVFPTRWEVVIWSYDAAGASTGEVNLNRVKKGFKRKAKKWRS